MAGPLIVKLAEMLPDLHLINTYGSTETTGPQAIGVPVDALRKRDCVCVPVPGAEIIIMDDKGHAAPAGETGEIWIRGGGVSPFRYDSNVRCNRAFASSSSIDMFMIPRSTCATHRTLMVALNDRRAAR